MNGLRPQDGFVEADTERTRTTFRPRQLWRVDLGGGWILPAVVHAGRRWFARH